MRVTNNVVMNTVLADLFRSSEALLRSQSVVSTGRSIVTIGDNPLGTVAALDLQSATEAVQQFQRNLAAAQTFTGSAEAALTDSITLLQRAREVGIAMGTDTATADMRTASAQEIDALLEELVALANRKVRDRYVFAGEQTGRPPFTMTSDGVVYSGGLASPGVEIDSGLRVAPSMAGDEAFGALELSFAGADLSPVLNMGSGGAVATKLSQLNGGSGVRAGSIEVNYGGTVVVVDLSTADDISDVKDFIESATGGAVTVGLSGAQDALVLSYVGPGTLTISNYGGSLTATDLGIAGSGVGAPLDPAVSEFTQLADLLGGAGVDGSDLSVTIGSNPAVSISAAGTVGDLLQAINGSGLPVSARISDDGRSMVVASRVSGPTVTLSGVTANNLGVAGSGRADNVFTALIDLRDAMLANDGDAIRSGVGDVAAKADMMGRATAKAGALMRRLDASANRLEDERLRLDELLSGVLDANYAEAVVKFQQQQNAYNAALKVAAEVLPMSILDFL